MTTWNMTDPASLGVCQAAYQEFRSRREAGPGLALIELRYGRRSQHFEAKE